MSHPFYKTRYWIQKRARQLREHPLCAYHLRDGVVKAAEIVHHVTPHRGDWGIFCRSEIMSLCKPCHDGLAKSIECRGYDKTIGVDGWPVDAGEE
jgi:5-methylcytosine-specific restriction endonuclease McrA